MDALVVMIQRGREQVVPGGDTLLMEGDLLMVSTPIYEEKEGGVPLREIPVEQGSPWVGQRVREVDFPSTTLIVLLRRADGSAVVPKGETEIQEGDTLVVTDWEEIETSL